MAKSFYATLNTHANKAKGNQGFSHTREIMIFDTKAECDEFVNREENRLARRITRKEAIEIYRDVFRCIGQKAPPLHYLFDRDF